MVTYNNQLESFYMPLKWLHTSTVVLLQYYYILKNHSSSFKEQIIFQDLMHPGFHKSKLRTHMAGEMENPRSAHFFP